MDRWIVLIQGELDITARPHLGDLAAILAGTDRAVDLDLSGVTFIDSSGWSAVLQTVESLNASGPPTRVIHESDAVRRLRNRLAAALVPAA